ncbi:MAG: bis(5'-nucleosyl)-tetraphosphatase (symmetrical) YqeK [Lachnospiraceae bacterium]|nr:bis(5'-nucleosyl)-tetraphosphatase (symmetrical) YqeK [Lachnospiraceae bacterium]
MGKNMGEEIDISKIRNTLRQALDEKRFTHTIAVCDASVMLAEKFGADKEKAYLAALLHDCARGLDTGHQLMYCAKNNIELDDYMKNDINPVHALISADMAKQQFGINDKEILDAIYRHAVGCADMTLLDKIIFVADMIEPNRKGKDADKARKAAAQNLDKAIFPAMRMKAYYLQGKPMHPDSIKMLRRISKWKALK